VASARYSIGIDLGTTNSALAFAPLVGNAKPEVLLVPQWESLSALAEQPTLPSFLYLPEEAVAAQLRTRNSGAGEWIVGRLARNRMAETPGRVVHSAKSWLCHHAADRSASFLPWGSTDLAAEQKISPVRASALILNYLRGSWDNRFAAAGHPFDDQNITVTVPASFDAAAQRLTIAAAEEAGFPSGVRLLEEPQAAFYSWLEDNNANVIWQGAEDGDVAPRHVLVVDIGGGTSDFSLFELRPSAGGPIPDISRVAVSDHILLGGDNIDLALAHLAESSLPGGRGQVSGAQWDRLVSACRDLKETVLSRDGAPDERFVVAVAGRGASMMAGAQSATLTRSGIERLLLDGFFPACDPAARPHRLQGALQEWGLPYASDSAVTRHLADFLRERPRVDAILFNGGSVGPAIVRQRIREQVGAWQNGQVPLVLENADPALAVARGAARYGALLHRHARHIGAGAAHAVFLEVHSHPADAMEDQPPALVCVLPHGALPEEPFEIAEPPLALRTDQLVRFQAFSSTRRDRSHAGDIVASDADLHALPPLQTIARTDETPRDDASRTVPVRLVAKMNALGLLQISVVSADPALARSWPLEFDLRAHDPGAGTSRKSVATVAPNAATQAIDAARNRIGGAFARPGSKPVKTSSGVLFKGLEQILGAPRSAWNAPLLRALWPALDERRDGRGLSADHEEAWLILAGFLLRPGFGVAGDDLRMDALWRAHDAGARFPGRRIKTQEYLLWRRVAGGLTQERQAKLLSEEIEKIRAGKPSPELVRLAGSLELLPIDTKAELITLFIDHAAALAEEKRDCAPYLASLGHLLNRAPLHAGPEMVVSPDFVDQAYAALRNLDWTRPDLLEVQTLFLRAARVVGDRRLDVPKPLRNLIAGKLEKSGVPPLRTAKIREFMPIQRSDRVSMYDEALPPGLVFGAAHADVEA